MSNYFYRWSILHIRIPPSEIASFSSRLKAVSIELDNTRRSLYRAVGRLDWEVSRRPEIDSLTNKALTNATRLSDEAFRLSFYLKKVESRFQEADNSLIFNFKEALSSLASQNEGLFAVSNSLNNASQVNSQVGLNRKLDIIKNSTSNHVQSLSWINGVINR